MSERKSWDIAPRPRKASAPAPAAASRSQAATSRTAAPRPPKPVDMVRPPRPTTTRAASPASRVPVRVSSSSRPARASLPPSRTASVRPSVRTSRKEAVPAGRLRERRQQARKATRITMLVVGVLAVVSSVYALWLPQLRVQEVVASGINAEEITAIAEAQLTGTYALIVPRNSILFVPQEPIREAALAQHPDVADVEIARASFTSLDLTVTPRAKAFIWCGTSFATPFPEGQCFDADGGGLIYRASDISIASTSSTITSTNNGVAIQDLRIYGPLDAELPEGEWPIGVRVSKAASMPDVLKLVEAINSLNVPIVAITLRDDEADLWVNSSTRLTYVVGRELGAAKLAASVIPTLDLTDGTIQYLDLRFNGKAYLKRYGE